MRASEFITEVFQPGKKNWEWLRRGSEEANAQFKVGDREYRWDAFTQRANPKKWEIQFRLIRTLDDSPELDLFGKTGTGNSAEVLSTAVDITRSFLEEYGLDKVEEITFNAKDDPKDPRGASRASLYARMIKRLLPNWDLYKRMTPHDGMQFTLTDRRAYDKPENKIGEASYKGNLGMMEMMKFFKVATQDEKDYMKSLLAQGKQDEAWELLQQVTGEELVDEGFADTLKKGVAAGAIALGALGAGNADAKVNQPVMKPGTYQKVEKPDTNAYNVLSNNSTNEITVHKAAKKAGLKGAELAQFLAQMKHESWDFNRLKEKAQPGVKGYFAKRYDMKYSPKTAKILGNTKVGDGERYHGRGFVQLTGRDNYRMAGDALGIDLLNKPELAAKPEIAAKIAVWYWQTRVKPYVNNFHDTAAVTKKINPALRGIDDRHENFKDYLRII